METDWKFSPNTAGVPTRWVWAWSQPSISLRTAATLVPSYTWVSALFSQVRGGNLDFELAEMIRTGTLSQYLLRPVSVLEFGFLVMDLSRHTVIDNGQEVKLTAKEFLLLQYLLQHRGRVLSRDLLLTDVWGYHYTGGTRTVDVHVRRLREKLPILVDALVTVKQFGYKLMDQ